MASGSRGASSRSRAAPSSCSRARSFRRSTGSRRRAGSRPTGSRPRTTGARSTTRSRRPDAASSARSRRPGTRSRSPSRARWRPEMQRALARFASLLRNLVHKERVDRDLDEELGAAFELLVEEKLRSGMPAAAARRAARLELGSVESLKGQVQDERAGARLDAFGQDVRYALRSL